jgi:hypothetical protein
MVAYGYKVTILGIYAPNEENTLIKSEFHEELN